MDDLEAEPVGQALGHERAMAGLGRRLNAQQRPDAMDRQLLDERLQGSLIEYLVCVAADVLGREADS